MTPTMEHGRTSRSTSSRASTTGPLRVPGYALETWSNVMMLFMGPSSSCSVLLRGGKLLLQIGQLGLQVLVAPVALKHEVAVVQFGDGCLDLGRVVRLDDLGPARVFLVLVLDGEDVD